MSAIMQKTANKNAPPPADAVMTVDKQYQNVLENVASYDATRATAKIEQHALKYPEQVEKQTAPIMLGATGKDPAKQAPSTKASRTLASAGASIGDMPEQWKKLYPKGEPNQHGHILLSKYEKNNHARGLGYGSNHQGYFQYLSHYKTDESALLADQQGKKGTKPPPEYANGLGYGPSHIHYNWYLAPKTKDDL